MKVSHFDNMDSDYDSDAGAAESNQILYDIVTYKEWKQDPEVCRRDKEGINLDCLCFF
jgi:hypothetical protein